MELPKAELDELAQILDSGELTPLRDRFDHPRRVRQQLQRFTDRIFLFPFGIHPIPNTVQVFWNGLAQWMGEEAQLVRVGRVHPVTVCVLRIPTKPKDMVQATYTARPEVGR